MLNQNQQVLLAFVLLLFVPLSLMFFRRLRERKSQNAWAEVIDIEEIELDGILHGYPIFRIVSGEHRGKVYRSEWARRDSTFTLGDRVAVGIFPETGEIFPTGRSANHWIIWAYPFFSFAVSFALFYYFELLEKISSLMRQ